MAKQKNIWKFNEDDWKVHVKDKNLLNKLAKKFGLKHSTIYYENGVFTKETSWDIVVPDNMINKVKKYIKENT